MNSDPNPTTVILYSDELKGYDFGIGHPFRGDRYNLFYKLLQQVLPENNTYRLHQAKPATDEELLLICDKDYIEFTRSFFDYASLSYGIMDRFSRFHSGDNMVNARPTRLERTARLIVGQARTACDLIQAGQSKKAISIGGGLHHAKHSFGEGFCLYNDVAFCGRYLTEKYGLKRVLILDTDAHAGNGTAEYFYDRSDVLFIDIHQDPRTIYPGTGFVEQVGAGKGEGFTVNIPLPPGAGDSSYELAFDSVIMPIAREFQPDIIIQNGGSDPHFYDELTHLNLSLDGFKMVGERVSEMASICGNRIISLIASGYNREILPYAWLSLIGGILGVDIRFEGNNPEQHKPVSDSALEDTRQVITAVKNKMKKYWNCFSQG